MSWVWIVLLVLALYLAFKLVGVVLKLALFVAAVVIGYALLAPYMDWPSPAEIAWVLGPDTSALGPDGVRLPDTAGVRQRMVDGVAGAIAERVVPGAAEPVAEPPPAREQPVQGPPACGPDLAGGDCP